MSIGLHIRSFQGGRADAGEPGAAGWWRSPGKWPLNPTVIWPLVLGAVLAGWTFSLPPAPGIVTPHRPVPPRGPLPYPPPVLAPGGGEPPAEPRIGLQAPRGVPGFRDPSYATWYNQRHFLWYRPWSSGIWFGLIAAVVHVFGYLISWWLGADPDTQARRRGESRNRLAGSST